MLKLPSLLLLSLLVHSSDGLWVNEDFWTVVTASNELPDGRSIDDFARIDNDNIFPAFWITRTRYANEHFEAFGYAFVRPDGRICGWFPGLRGEPVEVCGGFRVLSVPERYRGQKIFSWVPAPYAHPLDTIGFNSHRIARRIDASGNVTYGDAVLFDRSFLGVVASNESGQPEVVSEKHAYFTARVSMLRLLVNPREDNLRGFRHEETAVAPPQKKIELADIAPLRMFIPVDVVLNEKGQLFERKIVDGRLFFYPFNIKEKGALSLREVLEQQRAAHKRRVTRRAARMLAGGEGLETAGLSSSSSSGDKRG